MSDFWMTYLVLLVDVLAGAVSISCAIHNFKRKSYFPFGIWTMFTISNIAFIVRTIFTI